MFLSPRLCRVVAFSDAVLVLPAVSCRALSAHSSTPSELDQNRCVDARGSKFMPSLLKSSVIRALRVDVLEGRGAVQED